MSILNNILQYCYSYCSAVPQKETDRDHKIVQSDKAVQEKLKKAFAHAQSQMAAEADNPSFKYHVEPQKLSTKVYKFFCSIFGMSCSKVEKVGGYEVGVYHDIGRRPTMEDEHIATEIHITLPNGQKYSAQLFGVFDGHGGPKAAMYVEQQIAKKLQEKLSEFNKNGLSDVGIWNALKLTMVELSEEYRKIGERKSGFDDGTTATVALILNGKLWVANVGDSRTILQDNVHGTMQLSEDAKPDDPRYKKSIVKRGGFVSAHRINGNLAVGRAIGDLGVGPGMCARPKITQVPLSKISKNSHLILTCDGIYDVASSKQVGEAIKAHASDSAAEQAKAIVKAAYDAGSTDNLSALVVKF